MNKFCCKCGKTEEEEEIVEGFCLSCYKDEFPLIVSFPEKQFNITSCKICGDLMFNGKWKEVYDDTQSVVFEFLDSFITKAKIIKNAKKILVAGLKEIPYDVASKQMLTVIFEGSPKPEVPVYQQEVPLELVVNIGICERCAQHKRGYFESIVQIRSDKREIRDDEQITISKMIEIKKEEMIGHRMAYISKTVDQDRGGIDLYIGTEKFAKTLAHFLAEKLAASIEYSTKLKTMKDGKPIYQSTYCVRIPYFEIGDIVSYQNNPCQIMGINYGRVNLYFMQSKESKTLSMKESHPDFLQVIKKKDQFQKFILVSIQESNISVMNTITFENLDIDKNSIFAEHQDGDEILMVDLLEGLFECHKF
ncbi:MAG TPA: NMD3-related protein [Candidatus Bathyarchaeia archaeon]|nr:NMD3-related protein [Candidatus Bathyarchaeia archaeon]